MICTYSHNATSVTRVSKEKFALCFFAVMKALFGQLHKDCTEAWDGIDLNK